MNKIIDAHSHFMPSSVAENTTFFKVNWSNIEKQLKSMDELGIERSLLLYPTSDAHLQMNGWSEVCQRYNEGIAKVVEEHGDRFIGAGILPVDSSSESIIIELKKLKDLGINVVSLASSYDGRYLDDEMFFCVYEFALKNKMLVHVHPQIISPIGEERVKDPLLTPVLEYVFDVSMCIGKMMMNDVFNKFADVDFIFAHYGGVVPFVKERFDNTYQMLRGRGFVKDIGKLPGEYFKNLYLDMSGTKSPGALICALEMVDSKHILFGSDYPANQNIKGTISVVDEMSLNKSQKNEIFSENALNLLKV